MRTQPRYEAFNRYELSNFKAGRLQFVPNAVLREAFDVESKADLIRIHLIYAGEITRAIGWNKYRTWNVADYISIFKRNEFWDIETVKDKYKPGETVWVFKSKPEEKT